MCCEDQITGLAILLSPVQLWTVNQGLQLNRQATSPGLGE